MIDGCGSRIVCEVGVGCGLSGRCVPMPSPGSYMVTPWQYSPLWSSDVAWGVKMWERGESVVGRGKDVGVEEVVCVGLWGE